MLWLDAPDAHVWERFHERRFSDAEIAVDPVLSRWARAARVGARADGDAAPIGVGRRAIDVDALAPVLGAHSPFDAFAGSIAGCGYAAMLADPRGVIVRQRAAERFAPTLSATRLVEGARWSEDARGTNAIGTALVEGVPVAVLGPAHFEHQNHALGCFAAPLRDARGELVGVLDATGPAACASPALHAAVIAAAASMEALLVARGYDDALVGGLRALERRLGALLRPAFVIERGGRVRLANAAFASLSPEVRRRLVSAIARAGDARTVAAPSVRGAVVEIEPIGPAERPIAHLVQLVSAQGRAAKAAPPKAAPHPAFAAILGGDPAIVEARDRAARFAASELPVLLLAETGTGKELFARAVHAASGRAKGPFVAVNCGALSGALLDSELFGYAPGAFTGARSGGCDGKLAAASAGTLFLDEVAEMAPSAQAMLLRFLEDGAYYRVGEASERRADVRIVAATCRDLPALVASGAFRSDLYYRIRGATIALPPLRERRDRMELAEALLARVAGKLGRAEVPRISTAARAWIEEHRWPGNVRELRTALEHALVLAGDAGCIDRHHLPAEIVASTPARPELRASAERDALARALAESPGNLSRAARRLGVSRSTLYRMLERHGMRVP